MTHLHTFVAALMPVDPDEEAGVGGMGCEVRDAMSAILGHPVLLRLHFYTPRTHGQGHGGGCLVPDIVGPECGHWPVRALVTQGEGRLNITQVTYFELLVTLAHCQLPAVDAESLQHLLMTDVYL